MTTVILGGSNKRFSGTKAHVHKYFVNNGFNVFNVCDEYRKRKSDIAVELAIEGINDRKFIYIVTYSFVPDSVFIEKEPSQDQILSPYIGTRSIMLIQFGFDHKIDVFLSHRIKDMEDVQEKLSAIALPCALKNF